ncbi:MAG: uncharacterized protein K0R15_1954 [Clostridiales bacterium]|nr:uncharacterized protein [Clostridiales bacterium]
MGLTKDQALAFVVRIVASEEQAELEAEAIELANTYGEGVTDYWARGYLKIAADLGLITQAELVDAFTDPAYDEEGNPIEQDISFYRDSNATREQVAEWVVKAISQVRPDLIQPLYSQQAIYQYTDNKNITPIRIPYVEAAILNKLLVGNNNLIRPKDALTRAEMLQILKNADNILYSTRGLVRKSGVVERLIDDSTLSGTDKFIRKVQIRNAEGLLENIEFEYTKNEYDLSKQYDIPTFYKGENTSLMSAKVGDSIEYIVDDMTKIAKYAYIKGAAQVTEVKGILQPLNDLASGKITIKTDKEQYFTYTLSKSEYIPELNQLKIDTIFYNKDKVPVGNYFKLSLLNDIVVGIDPYATVPINEFGGIVKDIDTELGYIEIINLENNKEITKLFYAKSVIVEKQNYYNSEDSVGYFDEVFDVNLDDERDADINDIEVGDIAYIKMSEDGQTVTHISAKTNYTMKYGKILSIDYEGEDDYSIRVGLDDGRTTYYNINSLIPVRKNNVGVPVATIKQGDWVKLLINQAILDEGHVEESVKQIVLDTYNSEITNIYKGNLGIYTASQNNLSIQNCYNLEKTGWRNYSFSKIMELGSNIDVYYNNRKINLSEAMKFYNGSGYNVFLATERYYDREKIVKINIIDARDSIIPTDNVIFADGNSTIKLLNYSSEIKVNNGTIVVRNGRLVTGDSILAPDYTQVVLGGAQGAAVINITQPAVNASITVSRGRIKEISDLTGMTVSSQGMLKGMAWVFSPIEREYDINSSTIIKDETGIISLEDFKTYGPNTQYDEVFNIVSEGTTAKYVIKSPYCKEGIKGTVYEVDGTTVRVKDVVVYDYITGTWSNLSLTNNYAEIEIQTNSLILKNNKDVDANNLEVGDQISVLTTVNLASQLKLEQKRNLPGYIILVEE